MRIGHLLWSLCPTCAPLLWDIRGMQMSQIARPQAATAGVSTGDSCGVLFVAGRAAERLAHTARYSASTIHRLLKCVTAPLACCAVHKA